MRIGYNAIWYILFNCFVYTTILVLAIDQDSIYFIFLLAFQITDEGGERERDQFKYEKNKFKTTFVYE